MKREFKFRAWLENPDRMYVNSINYAFWAVLAEKKGYTPIVMQYTGVNDRNNKEIYEGDIVKLVKGMEGEVGEVWWQPVVCEFVIDWSKAKNVGKIDYQLTNNRELEVIGNIYERI